MLRITDKRFVYRDSANTDVGATFKRVIARQKREAEEARANAEEAKRVVAPLRKASK